MSLQAFIEARAGSLVAQPAAAAREIHTPEAHLSRIAHDAKFKINILPMQGAEQSLPHAKYYRKMTIDALNLADKGELQWHYLRHPIVDGQFLMSTTFLPNGTRLEILEKANSEEVTILLKKVAHREDHRDILAEVMCDPPLTEYHLTGKGLTTCQSFVEHTNVVFASQMIEKEMAAQPPIVEKTRFLGKVVVTDPQANRKAATPVESSKPTFSSAKELVYSVPFEELFALHIEQRMELQFDWARKVLEQGFCKTFRAAYEAVAHEELRRVNDYIEEHRNISHQRVAGFNIATEILIGEQIQSVIHHLKTMNRAADRLRQLTPEDIASRRNTTTLSRVNQLYWLSQCCQEASDIGPESQPHVGTVNIGHFAYFDLRYPGFVSTRVSTPIGTYVFRTALNARVQREDDIHCMFDPGNDETKRAYGVIHSDVAGPACFEIARPLPAVYVH